MNLMCSLALLFKYTYVKMYRSQVYNFVAPVVDEFSYGLFTPWLISSEAKAAPKHVCRHQSSYELSVSVILLVLRKVVCPIGKKKKPENVYLFNMDLWEEHTRPVERISSTYLGS